MAFRSQEDIEHDCRVASARLEISKALTAAEGLEEETTVEELCEALAGELQNLLSGLYVPTWKREAQDAQDQV